MQQREEGVRVVLRRVFAALELLVAVLFAWIFGFDAMTARRVGGDGIGTGLAHAFAPSCILLGVGAAVAAIVTWRGAKRWGSWQLGVLLGGPTLLFATALVLILAH